MDEAIRIKVHKRRPAIPLAPPPHIAYSSSHRAFDTSHTTEEAIFPGATQWELQVKPTWVGQNAPSQVRQRRRVDMGQEDIANAKHDMQRRHHRRNPAVFDATGPTIQDIAEPQVNPQPKTDTPILSPNPISAAHQLRITNSIPQLMKALPPLPSGALSETTSHQQSPMSDTEISTRILLTDRKETKSPDEGNTTSTIASFNRILANTITAREAASPSRVKLRLTSPRSTGFLRKPSLRPFTVPGRSSSTPLKPRLRIKSSRGKLNSEPITAVLPRLENSTPTLEVDFLPPEATLNLGSLEKSFVQEMARLGSIRDSTELGDYGTVRRKPLSSISDQFDIPYPQSLKDEEATAIAGSQVIDELEPLKPHEVPQDHSSQHLKRLRRKVLFLQTQVQPSKKLKKQRQPSRRARMSFSSHDMRESTSVGLGTLPHQESYMMSLLSHRKGHRVRQWAKEAKRAVRSYVKKTLERSSE